MNIPDSVVPIVGYRQWVVGNRIGWATGNYETTHVPRGFVGSPIAEVVWPHTGFLTATCIARHRFPKQKSKEDPACDSCPGDGCSCGIYGMYHADAENYPALTAEGGSLVYGAVEVWGRVVKGTKGFRAQYAKIIGFVAPNVSPWRWPIHPAFGYSAIPIEPTLAPVTTVEGLAEAYGVPMYRTTAEFGKLANVA